MGVGGVVGQGGGGFGVVLGSVGLGRWLLVAATLLHARKVMVKVWGLLEVTSLPCVPPLSRGVGDKPPGLGQIPGNLQGCSAPRVDGP